MYCMRKSVSGQEYTCSLSNYFLYRNYLENDMPIFSSLIRESATFIYNFEGPRPVWQHSKRSTSWSITYHNREEKPQDFPKTNQLLTLPLEVRRLKNCRGDRVKPEISIAAGILMNWYPWKFVSNGLFKTGATRNFNKTSR